MRKQPEVTERTKAALRAAFWELYAGTPAVSAQVAAPTSAAPVRTAASTPGSASDSAPTSASAKAAAPAPLSAPAAAAEGLPLDKITIRAITERAGYNRATFYLYYHDVYDLLAQIEDELLADAREVIDGRLMGGDDLDFSEHMGFIAELARGSSPYFAKLLGERGDPAFVARFKQLARPLVERFLVGDLQLDDARRSVLCEFYLAGLVAAISHWLNECPEMSIEDFITLVVGALLH